MIALLLNLLVLILVLGIIYWVTTIVPLPPPFRIVVNVIMAIIAIVVLLGFVGWVPGWHIGHYHY